MSCAGVRVWPFSTACASQDTFARCMECNAAFECDGPRDTFDLVEAWAGFGDAVGMLGGFGDVI